MRLLALQFFSYRRDFLGIVTLYTLENDKPLKWSAMKQPQLTVCASPLVFASLLHKLFQPLHIKLPAVECARMVELNEEWNAVPTAATLTRAGHSLEKHRPLVYRAEPLPPGSARSFSEKKRKP